VAAPADKGKYQALGLPSVVGVGLCCLGGLLAALKFVPGMEGGWIPQLLFTSSFALLGVGNAAVCVWALVAVRRGAGLSHQLAVRVVGAILLLATVALFVYMILCRLL